MIGELPDVRTGTHYASRRLAYDAGVHRALRAGICGTRRHGAESIVASGGYKDDEDYGAVIIYTGHGGQGPSKKQVSDQTLKDPGNAALVKSYLEGLPVRVLRGENKQSAYAPAHGYRYDGLYHVTDYRSKQGLDGFLIWQFNLEAWDGAPRSTATLQDLPVEAPAQTVPLGNEQPHSVPTTVQRIVRSSAVVRRVKAWHNDTCQMCGRTITLPGGTYSEGAHIRALGSPHYGPDTTDNVLCLCPNCHVMFDNGAIMLTDDLVILQNGEKTGRLRTHREHTITVDHVRQHRERWRG